MLEASFIAFEALTVVSLLCAYIKCFFFKKQSLVRVSEVVYELIFVYYYIRFTNFSADLSLALFFSSFP